MITIEASSLARELSPAGLTRFLNRARAAIPVSGEVGVLLADDPTLRRLNKRFRDNNKPTDVLSFPSPPEISAHHAGDLAISLDTAARQAVQQNHALRDEVRILLVHGLLHLAGFDHETDDGEMAAREFALRRQLRLPNTLIERTQPATVLKRPSLQPKSGAQPKTGAAKPSRKPTKRSREDR